MPAIKVVDRDSRQAKRRSKLWECFGRLGINPTNIKEGGKGTYYVIVPQDKVEKIISNEVKENFRTQYSFEIHTPIEYNAMRTIVIRHIDKVIEEYEDNEIITNIESCNAWAKVESIYRLSNSGRMLKVRFQTTEMAERAIRNGIIVVHQQIASRHIEKEIFIKLTPCYNCYDYNHKTQNCPKDKQNICAFCATKGHIQNACQSNDPKCINCGGKHKTLAAVCPIRKRLIKERGKEVRERSRSRSVARQVSYASVVSSNVNVNANMQNNPRQPQQQQSILTNPNINSKDTKDLVSKIITSIVYAHYMESLCPNSFQNTIDEMFKINGLPKVKFPTNIVTTQIQSLINDASNVTSESQNLPHQTESNSNSNNNVSSDSDEELSLVIDMDFEPKNKRARETNSPEMSKKKRENDDREMMVIEPSPSSNIHVSEKPAIAPKPQRARESKCVSECVDVANAREMEGDQARGGKREASLSRGTPSQHVNASQQFCDDIGITLYIKESYDIDCVNITNRTVAIVREALYNKGAIIKWKNEKYSYEKLFTALCTNQIDLHNVDIRPIPDARVESLRHELSNK